MHGKSHFEDGDNQNFVVFQSVLRNLKKFLIDNISVGKSEILSDESIKPPTTSNIAPYLNYIYNKIRVKYDGSCLKQDKVTFTHKKVVNIYVIHYLKISCREYIVCSATSKLFLAIPFS